jgi:hypothetical protein
MLHHISIAVDHPLKVAKVLAEIWQGRFFPFPVQPGSYIVLAGDPHGTAIEVLPSEVEIIPGETEMELLPCALPGYFTPVHAALSVPVDQETLERIGARESWLVRLCDRGPFQVVEFWLENRLLLELLPPAIAPLYLNFMTIDNFEAFMAHAEESPLVGAK